MYKLFCTYLTITTNTLLFINQAFNIYHRFVNKNKNTYFDMFNFIYATND